MAILNIVVTIVTRLPKAVDKSIVFFYVVKKFFSNKVSMMIDEFEGLVKNEMYEAAEIYLGNKLLFSKNRKIKVSKKEEKNSIKVTLEHNEKLKDVYYGHKFKWIWQEFKCSDHPKDNNSIQRSEVKSFKLTFRKKDKKFVVESYLPFIMKEAKYLKH
ncbi:hypothetical protein FXO37_34563 [Capsicum annuum]|nr:hypothetical protein FXO37_34563 [Capsicum annuum]